MSFGSKSRTTTIVDTTTVALEDVDGLAIIGGEGDITVTSPEAFDVANFALVNLRGGLSDALDFGERVSLASLATVGETSFQAIEAVETAQRSDAAVVLNNLVRFGGIAVAAIAVALIFANR